MEGQSLQPVGQCDFLGHQGSTAAFSIRSLGTVSLVSTARLNTSAASCVESPEFGQTLWFCAFRYQVTGPRDGIHSPGAHRLLG